VRWSICRRVVRQCFLAALICYVVFCALIYFFPNPFFLEPNATPAGTPDEAPSFDPILDKMIAVPGGRINYQLFRADENKVLVFYLHGNKGNLALCRWEIEPFLKAGFDVCMMDYRGFGQSTGSPSEFALLSDAQLVYERIKQGYGEENIIVWGRSFGSGVAAYVAAVNNPQGLVLESPYYSIPDCVRHRYPLIPTFLLRYQLRTCDYVQDVQCPVYLLHGTADDQIYFGSSVKLKKLLDAQGRLNLFHEISQGGHNLRAHPEFDAAVVLTQVSRLSEAAEVQREKGHVALVGDSIFDNKAYVGDGAAVIDQLEEVLPDGWKATLAAVDGSVAADVPEQLRRLPAGVTHVVLSVGGNDALGASGILENSRRKMSQTPAFDAYLPATPQSRWD